MCKTRGPNLVHMSRLIPLERASIRHLAFIAVLLSASFAAASARDNSYDMLYYVNGTVEPCILLDVTQDSIRYRLIDASEGVTQQVARAEVALIFKADGEFLLSSQPDASWKIGNDPTAHTLVTLDGRLFPAANIQEHDDIIFYQDPDDSTDASLRVAETIAIIYQNGSHKLLANANEVALGLSRSIDFLPSTGQSDDAVASTESVAAPLHRSAEVDTLANVSGSEPGPEIASSAATAEEDTASSEVKTARPDSTQRMAEDILRATKEVTKELELSNVQYKEYAAKAVNKAEYLGYYLDLLCDQTLDIYDKDQAIENALKLFVHDSTLVQVSSVTRDQTSAYKIRDYLKRLSLLNYDKVELVWRDVQYVTKFRLASDGKYYGAITVEQLFRGFKDGRAIYEDVTRKDVEIVLGNFKREKSGTTEYAWDVLLSNIGVEETRTR